VEVKLFKLHELDTYLDALKILDMETKLHTEKERCCQNKISSKDLCEFAYTDNFAHWHVLKLNKSKK
jgi:hypothetical protein